MRAPQASLVSERAGTDAGNPGTAVLAALACTARHRDNSRNLTIVEGRERDFSPQAPDEPGTAARGHWGQGHDGSGALRLSLIHISEPTRPRLI
eukprot:2237810-Rhodomonas_salina.2